MVIVTPSRTSVAFLLAFVALEVTSGNAQGPQNLAPQRVVDARMDSLEKVALTATDPGQRFSAVVGIRSFGRLWLDQAEAAGDRSRSPHVYYTGVVARLVRIYRQSNDYWTRDMVLRTMSSQAERAEAAEFLREVATGTDSYVPHLGQTVTVPAFALLILQSMGPEGRASLQQLYSDRTVTEHMARTTLDSLARGGFQKPTR